MKQRNTRLPGGLGVEPARIAGTTMKAVQMYSPYGYRAKIGLIVPSTNTANEPEFYRMAPAGVSIHTARLLTLGKTTQKAFDEMHDKTAEAAAQLGTAEVDVIAWGCTSGSFLTSRHRLEEMVTKASGGIPSLTTTTAIFEAFKALGAKRIAMGTPYVRFQNESEVKCFAEEGFRVVSEYGLNLGETQEERRGIGRVPPESLFRLVRLVDRVDADLVFLSCTNLPTVVTIEALEAEIGKPVVSSNLATFWLSLRMAGLKDRIEGFGRLLREC
ncbi:maleate cis-trans isomerase family protein [Shumkonia mesophila]|uniref:maleate cis-trans isomerase family protein n=1 Tax=Shumkonia mesophila TaxID=2838854 RepID=UPI0029341437|nr:aspartate/glutamate racemase family protein [Shumkonia mesophila]